MSGFLDPQTPVTISNYARGAWDGLTENNFLMKTLRQKGRFTFDVGGDVLEGPIEAGRYQPIVSAPGMDLSAQFQPKTRYKRWVHGWGEVANATVLDRGLLRRNSGQQALVKLKDTEIPAMIRDTLYGADNSFVHQFLQMDGENYAGTGLPFHGLPTFLYAPGTASLEGFDPSTEASTGLAAAATDKEVCDGAGATYAGLPTAPSALTGVDNLQFDAWMPTLVNMASSGFTGTGVSGKILNSLQYAVNRGTRFSSSDRTKMPDIGLLSRDYFDYLGDALAAKQTVYVENTQANVSTPNLGFNPHSLRHAGISWMWEAEMPASTMYLLNTNQMSVKIQPLYRDQENGAPFKTSGEDAGIIETAVNFDPLRRQYLVSATIPGQFCFHPRYFLRGGSYAA